MEMTTSHVWRNFCLCGSKFICYVAEEMDWDKDGKITFKEFLFAFTDWVGLEDETEEE